jgi:hypothetical protein
VPTLMTPLIRAGITATAILAATFGLSACASSSHRVSAPSSRALGGDSRLLGTWQAKEVLDAGTVTRSDAGTYDYLVFAPAGVLTRYEGDGRVPFRWSTSGNVLTMWDLGSDGGTTLGSDAGVHISEAFVALESSRRITYRITPKGLILLGRSRLTHGSFTNPTESVTPPANTPVRLHYVHNDGPPPSRRSSPATVGPSIPSPYSSPASSSPPR